MDLAFLFMGILRSMWCQGVSEGLRGISRSRTVTWGAEVGPECASFGAHERKVWAVGRHR